MHRGGNAALRICACHSFLDSKTQDVSEDQFPISEGTVLRLLKAAMEPVTFPSHPKRLFTRMRLIYENNDCKIYVATLVCGNKLVVKKLRLQSSPLLQSYVDLEVAMSLLCSNCPFIVAYYLTTRTANNVWLIMEHMDVGTLASLLTSSPFSEREIAYILRRVLLAVHYIHSRYRIHRDIKAHNVMVNCKGEVKLADFGWAVQLTETQQATSLKVGSIYWMAPEVQAGKW